MNLWRQKFRPGCRRPGGKLAPNASAGESTISGGGCGSNCASVARSINSSFNPIDSTRVEISLTNWRAISPRPKTLKLLHRFAERRRQLPKRDPDFAAHQVGINHLLRPIIFNRPVQGTQRNDAAAGGHLQINVLFPDGQGKDTHQRNPWPVLQCGHAQGEGGRLELRGFQHLFQNRQLGARNGHQSGILLPASHA